MQFLLVVAQNTAAPTLQKRRLQLSENLTIEQEENYSRVSGSSRQWIHHTI